jgi:hypothetical protein
MPGRITALVAAGLLALAAAGCGGGETAAQQVPGPPADVTIPQSDTPPTEAASSNKDNSSSDTSTSSDSSSSDSSTSSDSATPTPTSTPTGSTGTTGSTGGGTTAPDSGQDTANNDQSPPDGSNAQQFEDFCAQNPGAC